MGNTLMIVDGHVGKIFCRTELLDEVIYEKVSPYIIQASNQIEKLVSEYGKIPFYVDNGAFYLFEDNFCMDLDPKCSECPISEHCLKHTKWTAHQVFKNK